MIYTSSPNTQIIKKLGYNIGNQEKLENNLSYSVVFVNILSV